MSKGLTIDGREFVQAMRETAKEAKVEMGLFVRYQMALLCAEVIRKIGPPQFGRDKNLGDQKNRIQSGVRSDMNELFKPIPQKAITFENPKRPDQVGIRKSKSDKAVFFIKKERFFPVNAERKMAEFHGEHRGQKKLRVEDPMYVGKKDFDDYMKTQLSHVGRLKASWVGPMRYFNQKEGLVKYLVPSWIDRHAGYSDRFATSTFSDSGNHSFGMINSTLVLGSNPQGVINEAMRTREMDMSRQGKGGAVWRLQKLMNKHQKEKAA